MSTSPISTSRRLHLSYSVDGLPARDELLLKSLVRVLDHRSHQQWQSVDSGGDLRVSGSPFGCSDSDGQGGWVLRMGFPPAEGEMGLPMPLHAAHLEQMFNRVGDLIEQQRAQTAALMAQQPVRDDEAFKLRRWPQAAMVATPERRSLAALMSVRSHSLASLHRMSNVPIAQCVEFVRDLRQADLVITTELSSGRVAGDSVFPSDNPESRFPGSSAVAPARAPAATITTTTSPGASAQAVSGGLLARIRARFGLQPAWSR